MRLANRLFLVQLASTFQRGFQRPLRWLLPLLLGVPLAWAAGSVSINNLVITTVKQLSFAQARAEVNVNQQFTQTATVRLSPGAVSYRSSDTAVATVNAQTGQVSGVLAGEASIIASQAASPPYPAASASYTIRVKGLPITFQPWQLASVMYGMPAFQIAAPVSNVQGAAISYRLKDPATTVATITAAGLVTVKAVGKTTIVATQKPLGAYEGGSVEAELEVTAVPGLNDREMPYTTTPIDLLPQLGGQNVSYTSSTASVATIAGTGGQPQVLLKGLGQTVLEARNTAGVVVAKATWKVVAGQPNLTAAANPASPLPSTTFTSTLSASSNSAGAISFSIPDPAEANEVAEINTTTGQLWVKGPGTVQVKVSQAANGPWAAREITVPVTINDGLPGVVITRWPSTPLKYGDTFSIGYRTNFVGGRVLGYVHWPNERWTADTVHFPAVSHTPPAGPGQEGTFTFKVAPNTANGTHHFIIGNVEGPFAQWIDPMSNIESLVKPIVVDQPPLPGRFKLGGPLTMAYGERPVMPRTYDQNGVEVTDGNRCAFFVSSNTAVWRGVGTPNGGLGYDKDHWEVVGVGETTLTCQANANGRDVVPSDYDGTVMTVTGADPRLQAFPAITIGMDSSPYPLAPPASLNPTGAWTYEIVPMAGQPNPVAKIVNGQIVPVAAGTATLRATQAAGSNFREASIDASLTVNPAQTRTFETIYATYGDPDFDIPRPPGVDGSARIQYRFPSPNQDVVAFADAEKTRIHILNAGTTTIEASVGAQTFTGQVIVRQATPRLAFYFPPGLYFSSNCGEVWTWPVANAGTNNKVNGTLTTNSDGALFYPMGGEPPGNGADPYYRRWMFHSAYTPEMAVWRDAWVEQAASRNFLAARSPSIRYALWGNDKVAWLSTPWAPDGEWVDSCGR